MDLLLVTVNYSYHSKQSNIGPLSKNYKSKHGGLGKASTKTVGQLWLCHLGRVKLRMLRAFSQRKDFIGGRDSGETL